MSHFLFQTVLQYSMELVLGCFIPYSVILVSYFGILRRIRQTKFRRRIRSEKLILAIVLTFCLLWLPYHMVNIVQVCHLMFSGYCGLYVTRDLFIQPRFFICSDAGHYYIHSY